MEIENTYRFKWYHNLEQINKLFKQDTFNCSDFKETLTEYMMLTKKALDEIKELENTNKDLEAANWGLDCSQLFMSRIVEYGLKYIPKENMVKLIEDITNAQ
jgi:hypothetical protein